MEIFKHSNGKFSGTEYSIQAEMFPEPVEIDNAEESEIEFVNDCALLLKNLSEPVIAHLCRASERYCTDFLNSVGEPLLQFSSERSVLDSVYPSTLIIPAPNSTREPLVHMELNCEWEPEHGMEWVVRKGTVLYVGPFNGCDPYESFREQHSWNYAWQAMESP